MKPGASIGDTIVRAGRNSRGQIRVPVPNTAKGLLQMFKRCEVPLNCRQPMISATASPKFRNQVTESCNERLAQVQEVSK